MKRVKYSKYIPNLADEVSLDDLMDALSDFLLESGFENELGRYYRPGNGADELEALRQAIRDALLNSRSVRRRDARTDAAVAERGRWMNSIDEVLNRMEQEGFVTISPPHDPTRMSSTVGSVGQDQSHQRPAKFEVTDKGLDFLGYRTLRDLLGSLGRSSFGRHDTRDTATGIETSGSSKLYEFGDTMNLDINATLASAIQREGLDSAACISNTATCTCTSASISPPAPRC